jgi:hypothetical protein
VCPDDKASPARRQAPYRVQGVNQGFTCIVSGNCMGTLGMTVPYAVYVNLVLHACYCCFTDEHTPWAWMPASVQK